MTTRHLKGTLWNEKGTRAPVPTDITVEVLDAQVDGSNRVVPPYIRRGTSQNGTGTFDISLDLYAQPVDIRVTIKGEPVRTYTASVSGASSADIFLKDIILANVVPPENELETDIAAALTGSTNASGANPFATLQQLKDYSVPAGAKIVQPGVGYSTLTEALASISGQTADNPALIVVRGPITETTLITALPNTIIRFLPESKLIIDTATQGAGVTFNNVTGAVWEGQGGKPEIIRKTGGGGGSNFVFNFINPGATRNTLRNLIGRNLCHTSIRNYGGAFRGVNLEDCVFYGAGTDRAYGGQLEVDCYGLRTDFYGGDETIGGAGGTVPVGMLISNGCTGRFEFCRGFGGKNGGNGECHGIWLFSYAGQSAPTLFKCEGFGGVATGGNNDGINGHKSATATLDACIGVGGERGHGIASYGQSDNFARYIWLNCVGICRNSDATSTEWHGLNVGDGAFRDRFEGGAFYGSPFVASSGGHVATVAGNSVITDPAVAQFTGVHFIGGGAGMEAQALTAQVALSHALKVTNNAHPVEFEGCHFLSNAASAAISLLGTADLTKIRFDGGWAKSMRPDLNPAIISANTWNNAAIYDMKLRGGLGAGITPATATMAGSNFVL